ncbi:hypothetical protein K9F62_17450 [Desulfovibrio sp. JY]|nr:hypothetical protein K9F62_17450 [Desulfovibrio sp. JY]
MSIDLTTIFQAMPYVQNVAHAELVQPDAALASAQVLAQQALAEQRKQPQRIEEQSAMDSVGDERQRQAGGEQQHRPRRHPEPEPEETQASNTSPFAGQIINLKI